MSTATHFRNTTRNTTGGNPWSLVQRDPVKGVPEHE